MTRTAHGMWRIRAHKLGRCFFTRVWPCGTHWRSCCTDPRRATRHAWRAPGKQSSRSANANQEREALEVSTAAGSCEHRQTSDRNLGMATMRLNHASSTSMCAAVVGVNELITASAWPGNIQSVNYPCGSQIASSGRAKPGAQAEALRSLFFQRRVGDVSHWPHTPIVHCRPRAKRRLSCFPGGRLGYRCRIARFITQDVVQLLQPRRRSHCPFGRVGRRFGRHWRSGKPVQRRRRVQC